MTRLTHDSLDQRFLYSDPAWRETRDYVLRRDGYRCQAKIGECEGKLSVHHLMPLRHGGHLTNDHNLVTVCRRHHGILEARERKRELEIHIPEFASEAHRIREIAAHHGMTPLQWVTTTLQEAIEREWPSVIAARPAVDDDAVRDTLARIAGLFGQPDRETT